MVNEIISMVRSHYIGNYTGYDTYIDKSNILEHILNLCRTETTYRKRFEIIEMIINGEI